MQHPRRVELAVAIVRDGRPKYIIGALAGITGPRLSGIISGKVTPSLCAQRRLAEVLGVPVEDIFPAMTEVVA